MATIEPRLIHLLNDEPARPEPSTADLHQLPSLPSLQLPTHAGTREATLPPLQLDGLCSDSFLGSGRHAALPSINGAGHAVTSSPRDQATTASPDHNSADYGKEGKYAGSSGVFPLRLLLSDVPPMSVSAPPALYLSFSSILNDDGPNFHDDAHLPSSSSVYASGAAAGAASTADISASTAAVSASTAAVSASTAAISASTAAISASTAASTSTSTSTASTSTSVTTSVTTAAFASASSPLTSPAAVSTSTTSLSTTSNTKKRPKDDFLQLPHPAKKPKAHPAPFMPPIINGLLAPPPNVALFPPISSSAFDDTDDGQSKLLHELSYSPPRMSPEPDQPVPRPRISRKRSSKPRRKWSEEETNHLLMGVDRHGLGKWTSILDDPDFLFNSRSAGDLKDRFRTCCPEEMRVMDRTRARAKGPLVNKTPPPSPPPNKPEKTNDESPDTVMTDAGDVLPSEDQPASSSPTGISDDRPKKTRAHRMRVSDLVGLGITGPFKKARRRERTTFTTRDDQEILLGLETYGPTWTKIQRDVRFHLNNRKPTDLRDRVRNKYPDIYQCIEKGIFQPKDIGANRILEPMVNITISHAFQAAPIKRRDSPKWSFLVTNSSEQSQSKSQ
ncbi:hypothetical protein HDV63DRAFT_138443 [Trichoderma sp. SZMC 28014]